MKDSAVLLSPRSSLVGEDWKRAPRKLLVRSLFERGILESLPFPDPPLEGFSATFTARTIGIASPGANAAQPAFSVESVVPAGGAAETVSFNSDAPYEAIGPLLRFPRALLRFPAGYDGNTTSELTVALALPRSTEGAEPARRGPYDLGAVPFAASLVVEVGENAKARLVLRYTAPGSEDAVRNGLFLGDVMIRLARGASLDFVSVSNLGASVQRVEGRKAALGEGATLRWTEAVFDEGSGRHDTSVIMEGRGAELDYAGAWAASLTTEREHVLTVLHAAERTKSRSVLKSVLRDEARIAFRGLIEVTKEAPGTDAYLQNRNLLLDDGARAESLPQLKIDQDDVACSHGSTTGGPREDELFYLMSRGLDHASARQAIALGHLGSVLDRSRTAFAEGDDSGRALAEELEAMADASLSLAP